VRLNQARYTVTRNRKKVGCRKDPGIEDHVGAAAYPETWTLPHNLGNKGGNVRLGTQTSCIKRGPNLQKVLSKKCYKGTRKKMEQNTQRRKGVKELPNRGWGINRSRGPAKKKVFLKYFGQGPRLGVSRPRSAQPSKKVPSEKKGDVGMVTGASKWPVKNRSYFDQAKPKGLGEGEGGKRRQFRTGASTQKSIPEVRREENKRNKDYLT